MGKLQVSGPGYFGTRNVADEIVDARELTDALHLGYFTILASSGGENHGKKSPNCGGLYDGS